MNEIEFDAPCFVDLSSIELRPSVFEGSFNSIAMPVAIDKCREADIWFTYHHVLHDRVHGQTQGRKQSVKPSSKTRESKKTFDVLFDDISSKR